MVATTEGRHEDYLAEERTFPARHHCWFISVYVFRLLITQTKGEYGLKERRKGQQSTRGT